MPFARQQFLAREPVIAALRQCAERLLAQRPDVIRVVLFGSFARGDFGRRSDADLLVVVRGSSAAPHERIPEFLRAFLDAPVPVDCLVLTAAEIEAMEAEGRPFWQRLQREGITLATAPLTAAHPS